MRSLIGNPRAMQFAGVLPEDAPDPRIESRARLRGLSFPIMGLVPQPAIEDTDAVGISDGRDAAGLSQLSVSITYTLWRNPDDRDDSVNLADLDEQTRWAIDHEPPWPRPAWLIEQVERMRYPQLWEAVRTSWHRDPSEHTTVSRQLVEHANYILMNQFREELGIGPGPRADAHAAWQVKESAVAPAILEIDGVDVPAHEINTDPFVYAIGAQHRPDVAVTVVVAREHLPLLRLALRTREPSEARP